MLCLAAFVQRAGHLRSRSGAPGDRRQFAPLSRRLGSARRLGLGSTLRPRGDDR
jgi:hypothetical protein